MRYRTIYRIGNGGGKKSNCGSIRLQQQQQQQPQENQSERAPRMKRSDHLSALRRKLGRLLNCSRPAEIYIDKRLGAERPAEEKASEKKIHQRLNVLFFFLFSGSSARYYLRFFIRSFLYLDAISRDVCFPPVSLAYFPERPFLLC